MKTAIKSAQEATGLPPADLDHSIWGMEDSQATEGATNAYEADPKAHCMMSGVAYQVHEGKPIVFTKPPKIVITPSHRFASCNRSADKAVLLKHNDLGHNLLRRPFNFAPLEVQGDHNQLGPKALGHYLQRRNTKALIALHKDHFGPSSDVWQTGRGVPVEWFTSHQQKHILLHRVGTVPTMAELAHRTA